MAQIFTAISPAMLKEFELDYATKWYSRFGLVHYGCCERLDDRIDLLRQTIPNLRKITMSEAADVENGAEQIGGDYVMSRRPDPVPFITDSWEPDYIERDLRETVAICDRYGCPVQITMRTVHTARYKPQRIWEWADIAMRVVRDGHA
jgi:hypothetical protein